ncbi:MAG: hypothetical protein ABSC94_06165 [Polyangiaceae bacterium]
MQLEPGRTRAGVSGAASAFRLAKSPERRLEHRGARVAHTVDPERWPPRQVPCAADASDRVEALLEAGYLLRPRAEYVGR